MTVAIKNAALLMDIDFSIVRRDYTGLNHRCRCAGTQLNALAVDSIQVLLVAHHLQANLTQSG